MALAATATRTHAITGVSLSSGGQGVIAQADGSYLAGLAIGSDDYPYPQTTHWFRSTDDGRTWSTRAESQGVGGQTWTFPSNLHPNIALAPGYDLTTNEALIQRSTDGAAHWSTVYGPVGPVALHGRQPQILGVQSYNLTKAIAWGELDGDNRNSPYTTGLSSDSGATWTPMVSWDIGNERDICNAIGIAPGGVFYAQYTKFGGPDRTSNFAKTTNYGATWNVLSAPPGGTGTPPNIANAIACQTTDDIVIAGALYASPQTSHPGVWYSDDGGTTLTRLNDGDIADWPSGSFLTHATEIKRLTKDACLLALDQEGGTAGSPWRISQDRGHTFDIVVTPSGSSWKTYQMPVGKAVVTRDGGILVALWASESYDTADLELWRIDLTC